MKGFTFIAGIMIGMIVASIGFAYLIKLEHRPKTHKPVDLPEEIDYARPGDELIVDSIGKDSTIYISYHNLRNL